LSAHELIDETQHWRGFLGENDLKGALVLGLLWRCGLRRIECSNSVFQKQRYTLPAKKTKMPT